MSKFDEIISNPKAYVAGQMNKNPTVAGQPYDYWLKKLAPSEQDYAKMIQNMLMNIGSTQRQGINQATEAGAQYDLTPGAELALKNRANLQANKAVTEGTVGMEEYKDQATRQAWGNIFGTKQKEMQFNAQLQAEQEASDQEFWGQLLGMIGQGVGMAAGAKLFE